MADDVSNIFKEGDHLGLILNTSKCEVITHRGFNVQSSTLCSFQRVEVEDTVLLGAPLFVSPARDSAWSQRCDDLRRAVDRSSDLSSQEAVILLRASFSAPKFQGCGSRDLVLVSKPIKTLFEALVLVLVSEGGLELAEDHPPRQVLT